MYRFFLLPSHALLPLSSVLSPAMQFPRVFEIDGSSVSAKVDLSRPFSSISLPCQHRCSWEPNKSMLVSVPFGPSQFSCLVQFQPGFHEEDIVVGKDWSAQFREIAISGGLLRSASVECPSSSRPNPSFPQETSRSTAVHESNRFHGAECFPPSAGLSCK